MELKKSKKANLEKKKHSIFLFSLVVASGFILTAFEWATYKVDYSLEKTEMGELIEEEPVIQDIEIIRPQTSKPKVIPPITIDYQITEEEIDSTQFVEEIDSSEFETAFNEDSLPDNFAKPKPDVKTLPYLTIAGVMPSYPDGEKALFEYLGKKTKYSNIAKGMGIEGTVYVQFIVEKDGSITNAKVVRGVEPSLDQNALNTVKNMQRWNPGKQREEPVRVQLILPFKYELR